MIDILLLLVNNKFSPWESHQKGLHQQLVGFLRNSIYGSDTLLGEVMLVQHVANLAGQLAGRTLTDASYA